MRDTELKRAAREIFDSGVSAADPYRLLKQKSHVEANLWTCETLDRTVTWDLPSEGGPARLLVEGAGKAAASLARALEETLGPRIASGRIVVKHGHGLPLRRIVVEEGGHPLPDARGREATRRVLHDLRDLQSEDRVFFLLTGGASALLVAPVEGLTLEDKVETTRVLLSCGATIQEMNALRKHVSAVKGGRLLERMSPSRVMAVIISDVVGDDLSSIGSGPTAPDPTTFSDCLDILDRYGIRKDIPPPVLQKLTDGVEGRIPETPKPGEPLFESVEHLILGSNRLSIEAARRKAMEMGFEAEIFARDMVGATHENARWFTSRLLERAGRGRSALIAGGETTLEVTGTGKGGRNQEFALVAARDLQGHEGVVVLSAGTDGTDGPTDAAGALADGTSLARGRRLGMDIEDFLRNNDSYTFFDRLGDLVRTGPTGTNVMDLVVGLAF